MFSYSVARVSRSAVSSSTSRCAYQLAISYPNLNHQRRRSSSKTSTPPNGSQGSPRTRSTQPQQSSQSRRGRKAKPFLIEDEFAHLPSVPPTHHLRPADINISSFFSLHRPISVTTAIPPVTSPTAFADIFDSKPPPVPHHDPFVVVETLGDTIDALEQNTHQVEESWDENGWSSTERPMHKKASIPKNVPGRSRSAHLPFSPPPAPQPQSMSESSSTNSPRSRRSRSSPRPRSRSWTTTIVVTEFTASSGSKTYSAASTPLTRVPTGEASTPFIIGEPTTPQRRQRRRSMIEPRVMEELSQEQSITQVEEPTHPLPVIERQTGLGIVYNRVERPKEQMLAISVRRQRKLKMKKHKYKKLRKRTRNLRRKLGKL